MVDIVILGIFVADAAYRSPVMPAVGQTVLGTGFELGPGGKGSNQAVAAARSGGRVGFLSRIGVDTFGQMGRDVWAGAGVEPLIIEDSEAPTGSAGIFVDAETGDNAIVVVPGAAGNLSPGDINQFAPQITAAKVAVTQLEQPLSAAERFLELANDAGAATILNPAPAAKLPRQMLARCDYLTPNEIEAEELSGIEVTNPVSARAAAERLMQRGVRKGVIVTLGAQGVLYWDGSEAIHTPAISAGAVRDTTGAGDAFNGAFATALSENMDVAQALRFASACAGLSVTRLGTAAAMPNRAEIDALLNHS